jgi:uncharacterized phiE125 gp8 family phage protein
MRPQYSLTLAPDTEPVNIDQASEHLRVDSSDDLALIESLIAVAREYVDSVTGRVSSVSGWRLTASAWADLFGSSQTDVFSLHRTPLVSVESISYYAPDAATLTVLSASNYRAITTTEPGLIQIHGDLPDLDDRPDAIQIEFTAGYSDPSLAPAVLRHAIKMVVSHLYENRLPVAFASCSEIPYSLSNLIENQKVGGWIG